MKEHIGRDDSDVEQAGRRKEYRESYRDGTVMEFKLLEKRIEMEELQEKVGDGGVESIFDSMTEIQLEKRGIV